VTDCLVDVLIQVIHIDRPCSPKSGRKELLDDLSMWPESEAERQRRSPNCGSFSPTAAGLCVRCRLPVRTWKCPGAAVAPRRASTRRHL